MASSQVEVTSSQVVVTYSKLYKVLSQDPPMYFNIQPKNKKEDLFGVDFALNSLLRHLSNPLTRMVVIKGLRRTGKTSLLNVAIQEYKSYAVKIDVRQSPYYDRPEFYLHLVQQIKKAMGESLIEKIAKSISSVKISYKDFSSTLFLSKEENIGLFFDKINNELEKKKTFLVVAFDEAQLLKSIEFDQILASIFDNYKHIKLILTGSEIGLLDKFIGHREYRAPLFGRASIEIELKPLKAEQTADFLQQGFQQINKKISFEEIKEVIEHLDGILGWTTLYGWSRYQGNSVEKALELVEKDGTEIVRRELDLFLQGRKAKEKYRKVLRQIARGNNTWSLLKHSLAKERIIAADSQLNLYLNELLDYNFIEKVEENYFIADPLLIRAIKN